ncbi:MAG: VOC family protein [Candidatus Binataceae bacterium]|jgi:catechol 2,3-dioxygenase-like lactoylglutathione lyase family enzyme
MIHHVSIGVSDIAKARRFYDAALAPLGAKCLSEDASALGYGGGDGPRLWLLAAGGKVPRDIAGLHICLEAGRRAAVDAFHAAAVHSGGRDNGKPGLRADYGENYYAAFVTDPDGNRIEAYCGRKE